MLDLVWFTSISWIL